MWHILSTYVNEISFIICGFLGGMAHYMKKSMKGETQAKLWQWFGPANAQLTIYTLIVFTFVMIGALASGVINSCMTIWAILYTGFITGYAVDSSVNSNTMKMLSNISAAKSQTTDLFDVKPKE